MGLHDVARVVHDAEVSVERVLPIAGAQVVSYDYGAADRCLAALAHARATVGSQQRPRLQARNFASFQWQGVFRRQFDDAEARLTSRLVSVVDELAWSELLVHSVAGLANERQRQYNAERLRHLEAEEAAARAAAAAAAAAPAAAGAPPP